MRPVIDRVGKRFGKLTVISQAPGRSSDGMAKWLCRCDCGKEKVVRGGNLRPGVQHSCGCHIGKSNITHGLSNHPLYMAWRNMRSRCSDISSQYYYRYGRRGITVCEEWEDFRKFYDWAMSSGWEEGLQLDRVDNDASYYPDNCRFTTATVNTRNRPGTSYTVTVDGTDMCLSEAVERYRPGEYRLVHQRITLLGWSVEDALKTENGASRNG